MVFKRFRQLTALYVLTIILLTAIGVFIAFNTYFWLTSIWVFIFLIIVVLFFLKFVRKQHQKLSHFLFSINQNDFSPPHSKDFKDLDLNEAFNQLSQVITSLRDEAQINYQYLQAVINQVSTAIICIGQSEKIVLSNSSANDLFKRKYLRDINSLKMIQGNLPSVLKRLRAGEKRLLKFTVNGLLYNYSIQLAEFKLGKDYFKLFTFQNVQNELEQIEIESWQKLARVMSHEIMNSAIPISNLSGLVYKQLFDADGVLKHLDDSQKNDVKEGLCTIENRSKGLVRFVEATRNFTKMPKPDFDSLLVKSTVERVIALLNSKIRELGVSVEISIADDLNILADKTLIEQVLINIVLNALDALEQTVSPIIEITAEKDKQNYVIISVRDNGTGIDKERLENIFVPFYTTKKNGSGIGLSLVRQIMFLNKGNISVKSKVGEGTTFMLTF